MTTLKKGEPMNSTLRIAAALAVILISTAGAEARQAKQTSHQPPGWIDAAAIPAYPLEQSKGRHRASRQADADSAPAYRTRRQARADRKASQRPPNQESVLRIDKLQEYVKPTSPTEKLVTREAHELAAGIVRSSKTGATAHVSPRFAPIAQAIIDDLERGGASIKFMGGYRKGPCWSGGLHPCGLAIDLCQTARGVVDRRCNLPDRSTEARVAAAHGALSGGIWCNQDRGHVQLGQTAGACGSNLYSAVSRYKAKRHQAVRHHRVKYASRR